MAANVGSSADNITLTTNVTAEKLMYERAVEMSRTAAINELVKVDLAGGEVSYRTAIYMLEAVLDSEISPPGVASSGKNGVEETEEEIPISGLETEDRATVQARMLLSNIRAM
jgi:serine/threonine-protein kinase ULK2